LAEFDQIMALLPRAPISTIGHHLPMELAMSAPIHIGFLLFPNLTQLD
jgi:hypothetical protein